MDIKQGDNEVFIEFVSLLRNNDWQQAEKMLNNLVTEKSQPEEIINLSSGIYHFLKNDYFQAYKKLQKAKNTEFDSIRYLLIGDCMAEMNSDPISKNFSFKEIAHQYQLALDQTHNKNMKEIIKIHLKYARYGG